MCLGCVQGTVLPCPQHGAEAHALGCALRRIIRAETEAAQLRTEKEVLEKKLARAEETHKAELAKLAAVGGPGRVCVGV